jgi:hypothetical protein
MAGGARCGSSVGVGGAAAAAAAAAAARRRRAPRRRRAAAGAAPQQQQAAPQQAAGAAAPPPTYLQDGLTQGFLAWARGAGISLDRVTPAEFGGLRGLAATAAIRADDLVVSVPRGAALTLPPRQRCPCTDFCSAEFWDAAPWFVRLGVRLLAEKRKGAASPLAAYLQQLPASVDVPATWSDERLKQLQYPHLIFKVRRRRGGDGGRRAWRPGRAEGHPAAGRSAGARLEGHGSTSPRCAARHPPSTHPHRPSR